MIRRAIAGIRCVTVNSVKEPTSDPKSGNGKGSLGMLDLITANYLGC
jgi:hypothetical protein